MNKLSKPLTDLKSHYEVVVIGSGYGASIAASRMSRAGKEVCVLEKGKEFLPGDFPTSLSKAAKEMQFNKGSKKIGNENGLYEFVVGDEISVFKGCGLGGTSLVNANVSIKPEPRIFEDHAWPEAIRNDMSSLDDAYDRAKEMLQPNPYPEGKNGYPVLKKTEAMRKSAAAMNEEFRLLDINVTFETKDNQVGVHQKNCTNCGDCVTGCNRSAKNTTAMNYLPDAVNHGAEIFTEVGVDYIAKDGEEWIIYFKAYSTGREKFDAPNLFIRAKNIFLGAGSLGSTEILLRSKVKGLSISDKLGERFTGNGDVLGFGYNTDQKIHGIGKPDAAFNDEITNVGPCITSVIDMRSNYPLEDGMTLEEGTAPGPIRSILFPSLVSMSRLIGKDTDRGVGDYFKEKWREMLSSFGGPYRGAVDNTQIYLVMSNDDGDGEMSLKEDSLSIRWKDVGKQKIFKKVNGKLKAATAALGGNYVKNPSWTKALDYDLVTVHPLGGCIMADDASKGVVDHKGQVFASTNGSDLHSGLYVMDGAVIPRPVGTNPLLTISALAERSAKLIAAQLDSNFDYTFNAQPQQAQTSTQGVQFTETMKGYFSLGEQNDYEAGFNKGKSDSPFEFTLTIRSEDAQTFVSDKDHQAPMIGSMVAPALSKAPMTAQNATFNLFVEDPTDPDMKKMKYEAKLSTVEGKTYFFEGFKSVKNDKGFDVWKDTTTLFITIYDGDSKAGPVLGKGKLIIEVADFAKQITTMKAINTPDDGHALKAVAAFGKFFAGNVFDTYFKPN